jgi:hypothetical protein
MSNSTFISANNYQTNLIEGLVKSYYPGSPLKDSEWKKLGYKTISSDQSQETFVSTDALQPPSIVGSGQTPDMQITQERYQKQMVPVVVSTGFQVDETAIEDGKAFSIVERSMGQIPTAFNKTKELLAVLPFNNGYTETSWDGSAIFSESHALPQGGGTQSNVLSTAAPLSKTSVQNLLTIINTSKDYNGYESSRKGLRLIVHPNNEWVAKEITASPYNPDNANNAINAIYNVLPEGYVCNRYLTNSSNWFILTDEDLSLTHIERRALRIKTEDKIAERLTMCLADERYAMGIINPFGLFGSGNIA